LTRSNCSVNGVPRREVLGCEGLRGLTNAWALPNSVVVEHEHAADCEALPEELQRLEQRIVDVHIQVGETVPPVRQVVDHVGECPTVDLRACK
jgi:hypothetical protein